MFEAYAESNTFKSRYEYVPINAVLQTSDNSNNIKKEDVR